MTARTRSAPVSVYRLMNGWFSQPRHLLLVIAWMAVVLPLSSHAQLRPNLLYCGQSNANGSGLYDGGGPFVELRRCGPDADTQAVLVAQAANTEGRGAQWLDYLNEGGIIITGFGQGHRVYNEIYGTSYAAGISSGNCADNPMPSRLVNPDHPFWQANPIPVTTDFSSCGLGMDELVNAEPEVTALGAYFINDDIKFACRQQGAGTLYLLEADWEDAEPFYTEQSRDFMEALIRTRQCETGVKTPGRASGAEPPLRPQLIYCGDVERRDDSLFAGTGGYAESDSCLPDDETQVMFLGRTIDFDGKAAAWTEYLENGGMIVTSFQNSHLAYNELFDSEFERGSFFGNCQANAMPSSKLNEADPFWLANNFRTTPEGRSPCGYSLDAIVAADPDVTPLGADIETGSVGFACRGVGKGSLYLLDHNWTRASTRYSETSRRFMGALLRSPQCPLSTDVDPGEPPDPSEPPMPRVLGPQEINSIPAHDAWALTLLVVLTSLLGLAYLRRDHGQRRL